MVRTARALRHVRAGMVFEVLATHCSMSSAIREIERRWGLTCVICDRRHRNVVRRDAQGSEIRSLHDIPWIAPVCFNCYHSYTKWCSAYEFSGSPMAVMGWFASQLANQQGVIKRALYPRDGWYADNLEPWQEYRVGSFGRHRDWKMEKLKLRIRKLEGR